MSHIFFFSSRRRHTRFDCDWSSDVCSSDLFFRDPQTKEFLIAGTGQQHIEVAVSKMKKRYHTEVVLKAPKVPYRETIRGKADVQGRHKKQTGGHRQDGDCKNKKGPAARGAEFEFVDGSFCGGGSKDHIAA